MINCVKFGFVVPLHSIGQHTSRTRRGGIFAKKKRQPKWHFIHGMGTFPSGWKVDEEKVKIHECLPEWTMDYVHIVLRLTSSPSSEPSSWSDRVLCHKSRWLICEPICDIFNQHCAMRRWEESGMRLLHFSSRVPSAKAGHLQSSICFLKARNKHLDFQAESYMHRCFNCLQALRNSDPLSGLRHTEQVRMLRMDKQTWRKEEMSIGRTYPSNRKERKEIDLL